MEAHRDMTPEEGQRHLEEKRRTITAEKALAGKPGFNSTAEILHDTNALSKAHEAEAAKQAQDGKKKSAAEGAKVSVSNLPWLPLDIARYARPEYINACPAAKGLAEAFMVAYWRNQCRGLPTSSTLLAPILNGFWRSIKTHLDAIVSIQELEIDNNNGKPVFRCKWLDDAWKHAAEVSEGRRKGGLARQANAQQMQKG